jgi:hypothetical protein
VSNLTVTLVRAGGLICDDERAGSRSELELECPLAAQQGGGGSW